MRTRVILEGRWWERLGRLWPLWLVLACLFLALSAYSLALLSQRVGVPPTPTPVPPDPTTAPPTPTPEPAEPTTEPALGLTPLPRCSRGNIGIYPGAEYHAEATARIRKAIQEQGFLSDKMKLAYELRGPDVVLGVFRFYVTKATAKDVLDFYRAQAWKCGCLIQRDVGRNQFLAIRDLDETFVCIIIPIAQGELPAPDTALSGFIYLSLDLH